MTPQAGPGGEIQAQRSGSALVLTLARPDRANAYTQPMLARMLALIEEAENDPEVRALVVTGAGDRAFCGGADRTEIDNRDWRSVLALKSAAVFDRLRRTRLVTVAAINGAAVGGGLELALSCDLRIAHARARFWLPEPEFGLLPAAAATRLLPQVVGTLRARDLILGGAVWSAAQALEAGLLSEVVHDGDLMSAIANWLSRVERRDADALMLAKRALDLSGFGGDSQPFDLLAQALLVRLKQDISP